MHQKLFQLRHLVAGAREYSKREKLERGSIEDYESDWSLYYYQMRHLISNDLIELAAKVRVIQDTSLKQIKESDLLEMDEACRYRLKIGTVTSGTFALTLRESCNKIIHATEFEPQFANSRNAKPYFRYSYWNGKCTLKGSQFGKPWSVDLNVYDWSEAMKYFLDDIFGNVDW